MKKLLLFICALIALTAVWSCDSKADKEKQQHIADSLRKDSIVKQQRADSIEKERKEAELNEEKVSFLRSLYTNVIYPTDNNINPALVEGFSKKFEKHLSEKVLKALTDYDDDIEYSVDAPDKGPSWFLFGDQGDYGPEGPKITYDYLGSNWLKVTIAGNMVVKVRVESSKDEDGDLLITGFENKDYGISVK